MFGIGLVVESIDFSWVRSHSVLMLVETLGNAFSEGWRVFARCRYGQVDYGNHARKCDYRKELDMETLVWTRGRDFPLSRMESRLKCPRWRIVVMFEPPSDVAAIKA